MKKEVKSRLDAVLDAREASNLAATQAKQARESREEAFAREFNKVRDAVIRPAMEEMGKHVEQRGLFFEIAHEDETPPDPPRGGGRDASIAITFFSW
jgi:hypothetical protein